MADMNFERLRGGGRTANGQVEARQTAINVAGALISVALVLGLALWGYRLAVRDVSGVPVVLALQGPMRVAPVTPGGTVADNQGLAVNSIAAEGIAAGPAERLVLAPRPVELSLDDAPGLASLTVAAPQDQLDDILVDAATTPAAAAASDAVDPSAIDLALAAALSEGGGEVAVADPAPEDALAATDASGSVVRSPRPLARPSQLAAEGAATEAAVAQTDVTVASPEMQPQDVKVGTRLVQLGAFDSGDGARAEWTRLQGRFGDLMAGKAIIVQPATSGGQTFFRLRAFGFSDEDDARRFCSALLSEDASCIPVAHR